MFSQLTNEAKLTFELNTKSPLSIGSADDNPLNPTLPKMQCLRTRYNGVDTVFIPGSSLKGVIRSHCERIMNLYLNNSYKKVRQPCNAGECTIDTKNEGVKRTLDIYKIMCPACRMFGSTSIKSRIHFKDAYPLTYPVIGIRNSVGINRITGGAQKNAIFDYEVIEEGTFAVQMTLHNYELYQLKILLFALKDINDGYVAFGGSTSRGNGKMYADKIQINFKDYRNNPTSLRDYFGHSCKKELSFQFKDFYFECNNSGLDENLSILEDIDIKMHMER